MKKILSIKLLIGYVRLLCLLFTVAAFSSCGDDFLDRYPYTPTTGDYNKTEETVILSLNGVYNALLHNDYTFDYNTPGFISYDYFTGLCYERVENVTIGAGGGLTPDNAHVTSYWNQWYLAIAKANTLIANTNTNLSERVKHYVVEARVIRALAYYYLISVFGDVPLFDAPVTVAQFLAERTPKDKVLDFIISEMNECADILPSWIAVERGRVDKATAYAVMARAALLGGSLNYDGRGDYYFRIAAAAAAKVMDKRQLANSYDDLFTTSGQAKADVRSEMILESMFSKSGTTRLHIIGVGNVSRFYGQTLRHPSQRLVDTYECIDGKRIDESPLYDPQYPKRQRDPRLHSTIWMHRDTVTGNTSGTPNGRIKLILNAYEGADRTTQKFNYNSGIWETVSNMDIADGASWTSFANLGVGYMWRKFSNDTIENIQSSSIHFPIIRYAEVLLTYAEAKIELGELDDSVYRAINLVRNRVNMPDVAIDRRGDINKMRQLVRRERKVELMLEGLHLADMHRWGIGDIENDGPSYGMPKEDAGGYAGLQPYEIPNFKKSERHDLNDIASYDHYKDKLKVRDINRYWDSRFELWPIPQSERNVDWKLVQNPGY
ncbi:membrane protein [Bacteroidia bacterium]|nr:membrane protein [Bacteroidia bacterium]